METVAPNPVPPTTYWYSRNIDAVVGGRRALDLNMPIPNHPRSMSRGPSNSSHPSRSLRGTGYPVQRHWFLNGSRPARSNPLNTRQNERSLRPSPASPEPSMHNTTANQIVSTILPVINSHQEATTTRIDKLEAEFEKLVSYINDACNELRITHTTVQEICNKMLPEDVDHYIRQFSLALDIESPHINQKSIQQSIEEKLGFLVNRIGFFKNNQSLSDRLDSIQFSVEQVLEHVRSSVISSPIKSTSGSARSNSQSIFVMDSIPAFSTSTSLGDTTSHVPSTDSEDFLRTAVQKDAGVVSHAAQEGSLGSQSNSSNSLDSAATIPNIDDHFSDTPLVSEPGFRPAPFARKNLVTHYLDQDRALSIDASVDICAGTHLPGKSLESQNSQFSVTEKNCREREHVFPEPILDESTQNSNTYDCINQAYVSADKSFSDKEEVVHRSPVSSPAKLQVVTPIDESVAEISLGIPSPSSVHPEDDLPLAEFSSTITPSISIDQALSSQESQLQPLQQPTKKAPGNGSVSSHSLTTVESKTTANYFVFRSLSPLSDLSSYETSDTDSDTHVIHPKWKFKKDKNDKQASDSRQKKLIIVKKSARSVAETRIKKRKFKTSSRDAEPPLKRAREKVKSQSVEQTSHLMMGANSNGTNGRTPTANLPKEKRQRKRSLFGCEWPERTTTGDSNFKKMFIECSLCDGWYHNQCAGINPGDIRLNFGEIFVCPPCRGGGANPLISRKNNPRCGRPDCKLTCKSNANEFFVTGILGRTTDVNGDDRTHYWLLQWLGFPISASTWEPKESMNDSENMIEEFFEKARKEGISGVDSPHSTILLRAAVKAGISVPNGTA